MLQRLPFSIVALVFLFAPAGAQPTQRAERLEDWRARLGQALAQDGSDRAIELYRSILDEAESGGDDGILVARAVDGLADVYRERHRFDLARPLYERSAAQWKRLLGPLQPRLAVSLHNLGICYVELARWDAAERVLRQARGIWRAAGDETRDSETEKALRAALERRAIPWTQTTSPEVIPPR